MNQHFHISPVVNCTENYGARRRFYHISALLLFETVILVVGALLQDARCSTLLTTTQTQTLPFSFSNTIVSGSNDVQTETLDFSVLKTPKYVGSLTSLSIIGDYNVNLTFDALGNSVQGARWPVAYQFSFQPSSTYTAGALGTPSAINVTYGCYASTCITGGEPFPGASATSSVSIDKNQLPLSSILGRAGGPLSLTETTVMGGSPAILISSLKGSVTVSANYDAHFPPDAKIEATRLALELNVAGTGVATIGALLDPANVAIKGAALIAVQALDAAAGKIDAANGTGASASTLTAVGVALINGTKSLATILSLTGASPNPASIMTTLIGLGLKGFELTATKIANDPPDTNYKQIATVQVPDTSFLNFSDQSNKVFQSGKSLVQLLLLGNQQLAAVLVSMERAQGASNAGDQFWLLQQLQTLSDTMVAYNATSAQIKGAWQDYIAALNANGELADTSIVSGSDLVSAFTSSSYYNPNQISQDYGLTPMEVADLLTSLNNTNLSDPNGQALSLFSAIGDEIYNTGDLTGGAIRSDFATEVPEPNPLLIFLAALSLTVIAKQTYLDFKNKLFSTLCKHNVFSIWPGDREAVQNDRVFIEHAIC